MRADAFLQEGDFMGRLAEILVNRPSKQLNRTFTYAIPDSLSQLGPGWRCTVPFHHRTEEGIILSVEEEGQGKTDFKVLPVLDAVDPFPWFTPDMLKLAWWISTYYMCTLADALRLFLIDKRGIRTEWEYHFRWDAIAEDDPVAAFIDRSVTVLSEKEAAALLSEEDIKRLLRKGQLERVERTEAAHHIPVEKWIFPGKAMTEEEKKRARRQALLADHLSSSGPQAVRLLRKEGFSPELIRNFLAAGFGTARYLQKDTFSLIQKEEEKGALVLTEEQASAISDVISAIDKKEYEGILLKGVTGSGKTEVYLQAAEHALAEGGSVLILVPEIALTDQMVAYFARRFGDQVVFLHSRLSKGERYNNRMRVEKGESSIVIGSRSALFMPFRHLRLIVVDEEYDSSYKQDETPRYNGRDAAKMMAVIHKCPVVLGAATPSVSTYHAALSGQIHMISMDHRIRDAALPKIWIADMRDELDRGNSTLFSRPLVELLKKTTAEGKKAILFLNRRGYSTTLMCRDCGYVFKCPHCDVSLVYHKDRHCLKCHYCESVYPLPKVCPSCGKNHILYLGTGTQKTEEELAEWLPGVTMERLDLDSVTRKNSARRILDDFRDGKFQILLGTQMVAKGHNIPGVAAVGILSADQMMNRPSYLASEQTFNLITQCAGRAGRYGEEGEVILQTYNPEHYVITTAAHHDYEGFYKKEISFREALFYPPFSRMMKITSFGKDYDAAKDRAERIHRWFMAAKGAGHIFQATPPYDEPIRKVRNMYYISIMIRGKSLSALKAAMREAPVFGENGIIIDVDPL